MIPTERPVRAVERQRLTICLRISPFQPSLTPETTRAAHQHATLARIAAPSALLVFRMPPNRMFPLIRRRPVQTVSTIPRIEAHGALRTERCHGRRAVGVERPVRLSAHAAQSNCVACQGALVCRVRLNLGASCRHVSTVHRSAG